MAYRKRGVVEFTVNGDGTVTIPLTKGYTTTIDSYNVTEATSRRWKALETQDGNIYAMGTGSGPYLHRVIMDAQPGEMVDHIDRDGLNNCRSNLRFATPTQNNANRVSEHGSTSRYKGVSWHKRGQKWIGSVGGYYLGLFESEEECAIACDEVALKLWGDYARLNFSNLADVG